MTDIRNFSTLARHSNGTVLFNFPRLPTTIGHVMTAMRQPGGVEYADRSISRNIARLLYRKISRASRLQMVSNTPYVSNTVDAIKARRIAAAEDQVMAEIDAMSNTDGTLISFDPAEAKRLHKNELARARTAARNASKKV